MTTNDDQLVAKLASNMDQFKTLVAAKVHEPRLQKVVSLLNDLQDRIMVCPAATRQEQPGCYEGGLVDNALLTLATMIKLREAYGQRTEVEADSLVITALFHDLGKIGNESLAYFKPQESEWHRTKLGQLYEVVPQLAYMAPCVRSLWWLNKYGVELSEEEFYAIASLKPREQVVVAATVSSSAEPILALMLQQANSVVSFLNKKTSVLDK